VSEVDEEELEEIRRRRLIELQQRMTLEHQETQAKQRLEQQKATLLRRILTPEARQRLTNLRMVRPEFAAQLELQLIEVAQQGKVNLPITDEQLREMLRRLQSSRREIRIRRI